MSSFSDALENNVLDHYFRNQASIGTATVYVALYTADPSDAGGGTELSGNGYARQAVTFGAASGGVISNSGDLTFGPNTTSDWGTVVAAGVFTLSSGGTLLAWTGLTVDKPVAVGDSATIATGALSITLT